MKLTQNNLESFFNFLKEKENLDLPLLYMLKNFERYKENVSSLKGQQELISGLTIDFTTMPEVTFLPENLIIRSGIVLSTATDSGKVLGHSNINFIPDDTKVDGNVIASAHKGIELGKNIKVYGNLSLRDANIKFLPENLYVEKLLDISYTEINELPESLKVDGSLILKETNIRKLPKSMTTIKGDLDIRHTPIQELNPGMIVKGDLRIIGTPMARKYSWYEDLRNMYDVHGDIYA